MYSETGKLTDVGARLRAERLRCNANQTDFAELGGVKRNAQVSYESGKSPPNVDYLLRLEEHGVDIGFILTGRRQDGSVGFAETRLLELFERLSAREREAVLAMVMVLTGKVMTHEELAGAADGASIHDRQTVYRGEGYD